MKKVFVKTIDNKFQEIVLKKIFWMHKYNCSDICIIKDFNCGGKPIPKLATYAEYYPDESAVRMDKPQPVYNLISTHCTVNEANLINFLNEKTNMKFFHSKDSRSYYHRLYLYHWDGNVVRQTSIELYHLESYIYDFDTDRITFRYFSEPALDAYESGERSFVDEKTGIKYFFTEEECKKDVASKLIINRLDDDVDKAEAEEKKKRILKKLEYAIEETNTEMEYIRNGEIMNYEDGVTLKGVIDTLISIQELLKK